MNEKFHFFVDQQLTWNMMLVKLRPALVEQYDEQHQKETCYSDALHYIPFSWYNGELSRSALITFALLFDPATRFEIYYEQHWKHFKT